MALAKMGKYELVRQLATGGMAEVFLAKTGGALGFEKTVVVKRIRPHLLEDPQFLQMFLQEAKLAAQLNHPNIVQVFDFGEADGSYFLAMEYIDGPNLRTLSAQSHAAGKPIDFALCAKIISSACEGLAYAHDYVNPETQQPLNIVHRDISPDNIVLAKNGAVKVVDFGIAKAAEQLYQTQSGLRKGKLAYMSPEYLKGTAPDRRADVFALGMVLYELIANRKPYDADSEVSLMHAMLYEPMVQIRARRPDIPEALERVVDTALKQDRDERYPSCRELQADLEKFIVSAGEPLSAIHLSRLISEMEAAAPAKAPGRPRSSPGLGMTPPGAASKKTPAEKSLPKRASGEQRKLVTPAKVEASSDDSTVHMTAEELERQVAALAAGSAGP
ncbi:MAG TPA: serine/threonine-protein kinase, partial [Myxococcales bacterium]|nr:serine/threonine-protein kinase [Myxococcales bacterium]